MEICNGAIGALRRNRVGMRHARKLWARRTVSRFLCPGRGQGGSHSSRSAIAGGLERPTRNFGCRPKPNRRGRGGSPLVPYLVLLRVGFTLPPRLPEARCALTAPFHPYPGGCRGGTFSVALSVNYPLRVAPRPLAGTLPCGDRTFLPAIMARRLPVRQAQVDSSITLFRLPARLPAS